MTFTLTPEQEAICEAAQSETSSMQIRAYAGCAKTTTLVQLTQRVRAIPGLALAFNVKNKKDLERQFPPNFEVLTLNGLGHRAWAKAIGHQPRVEERKLGACLNEVLKEEGTELSSDEWSAVRRLVTAAQINGLVPEGFDQNSALLPNRQEIWEDLAFNAWIEPIGPTSIELAHKTLQLNCTKALAGEISFDDQIYCSTMLGGAFPRYPLVLVDEAQDLSPLNHVQLARCAADRLIVVGDPKQAIYAFRGADSSSMDSMRALRDEWRDLPLTVTFRCPKVIVARAQNHAPGFTAAPEAPKGRIVSFQKNEDQSWSWRVLSALAEEIKPRASVAVLCRNNAPLLGLAFKLLADGVGVQMLGRNIGQGLIALTNKILSDDETSAGDCVALINDWRDNESAVARANDHKERVAGINDRADCLLAVMGGARCDNAGALRRTIKSLFARDAGQVILSTGHRAKGLEWDLVVHLDPFRVPSKHAKKAVALGDNAPMEQELNLQYVIETRAKNTLVEASLAHYQGENLC